MTTRILTQAQIRALLPMERCIELMETALRSYADGSAINPLRRAMSLRREGAALVMMPGAMPPPGALGMKVISLFPSNASTPFDAHQGLVLLFDPETGVPRAILECSEITAIRTAAASAAATRVLAREDAGDLALLGSGVQARTHLEAMLLVRRLRRVRVFSPTAAHREAFVRSWSDRLPCTIESVASGEAAVDGADLVCATTSSTEPVVRYAWLAPGAHVNAVGSCTPRVREVDAETMRCASLFVDSHESLRNEAGDYLLATAAEELDEGGVGTEVGAVMSGEARGRSSAAEITLFKSLGIAVEDLVAAGHVVDEAVRAGVGAEIDLAGRRDLVP